MKEAWGNHLLENISTKVSEGYCIRNLKRPPFWSKKSLFPKFVFCKAG